MSELTPAEIIAQKKLEKQLREAEQASTDTSSDAPELDSFSNNELKERLKREPLERHWIALTGKPDPKLLMRPVASNEVKVRCPSPDHPDHDPSVALNVKTNLWVCYKCRGKIEGDIFDLVALKLGLDRDKNFNTIVEEAAKAIGIWKTKSKTKPWVEPPKEEEKPKEKKSPPPASVTPLPSAVTADFDKKKAADKFTLDTSVPDVVSAVIDDPAIEGTVIKEFLECYRNGNSPTQFQLGSAMAMVSLIKGHEVKLPPDAEYGATSSNQEYVFVGDSGVGKSTSINLVKRLLTDKLPFDRNSPTADGVLQMSQAGSGEVVVQYLDNEEITTPGLPGRKIPTKMLFCTPELAEISEIAGKANNTLESVLNDAYDNTDPLTTHAKSGSSVAKGAYVFVMTTTQPEMIRRSFTNHADVRGTISRITPWYGTPKRERAFNRHTFDETKLRTAMGRLISWTSHPALLPWSEEAEQEFERWFENEITPAKEERLAQGISKLLLVRVLIGLKKDVLVWATNCMHARIELSDVELVKKTWPYRLYCLDRATDNLLGSDMKELSDRIMEWIANFENRKRTLPTRRDIRKAMPNTYSNEMLKKAMDFLEHFDLIEMVPQAPGAKGGKPTERYKVNEG